MSQVSFLERFRRLVCFTWLVMERMLLFFYVFNPPPCLIDVVSLSLSRLILSVHVSGYKIQDLEG